MSNAKNIIKNLMEDNLVDTKKLIKQTLIQRIGVMLESKIEEVAPSMISERKTSDPAPESKEKEENKILKKKRAVTDFAKKDKKDTKLDEDYELFVDEIQEIVEEIEEETGEELSDEEIKTLGEQYLKYISEETT
jgi:hypothetical protein